MLEKLTRLFSGYENVYGQYSTDKAVAKDNGKLEGSAWTERGTPNWRKHVEGKIGLGIIPLRIDNTVYFGAIDVDVYNGLDHATIEKKIDSLGLPLVVCKSKSGGAHLYLFLQDPAPAGVVIDKLREWATILGHGKSEIFPKQKDRLSPDDLGNWINMPYFGGDLTTRYAIKNGRKLSLREFVEFAESRKTKLSHIRQIEFSKMEKTDEELLEGAPPCLCIFHNEGGVGEGLRNDTMFNAGVYAKKRWPDEWPERLAELNELLCKPPVNEFEMKQLVKSLGKHKTYEMRCNGPHCNKKKCRNAIFGRGPQYTDVGVDVGPVTKIEGDKAAWYLEINDKRVRMETKDLMSQARFNERCIETINVMTNLIPYPRWMVFVQTAVLERADIVQLPKEATWDGQFWHRFTQFSQAQGLRARELDEILLGKVFVQGEDILFLPVSLFEFLGEMRFKYDNPEQIWAALLDRQVKRDNVKIHARDVEVWRITKPAELKVGEVVPVMKEEF